jgi:hypothetical protein
VEAAASTIYPTALRLPEPPTGPARTDAAGVAAFGTTDQAMTWLNDERANLTAAARTAAEQGSPATAWRLSDAWRMYYYLGSHTDDWEAVTEAGLAAATAAGDRRAEAAGQVSLALLRRRQGRPQQAI